MLLRLWRQVDARDISSSWRAQLPAAAAALSNAQLVAAEMADPYLAALGGTTEHPLRPTSFAGVLPGGGDVVDLLYMPAVDAKRAIAAGRPVFQAIQSAGQQMLLYSKTTLADTGRLATKASMAAHHATGYYRALNLPSCDRCAILAGKWYRTNAAFLRHPKCDCYQIPVWEKDDSLALDVREAIRSGQVTGLSHEDSYAITQLGADPSQVVNAKRGLYTAAGGRRFTHEGTTRRGLAGSRMSLSGRRMRPTPEQILADATSRDDAIRLLTNYSYIL